MKSFAFLLLVFCFSKIISLAADPENFEFSFRRISPAGGFTYGAISSIGEDSNGFIWFGTNHGLYRYNSFEVKKFLYSPNDSTSISGNTIRSIFCDFSGTIWIGTTQGVCTYDIDNDQFVRRDFQDESGEKLGNNIREIFQSEDENIYFLSPSMLARFNIKTNHFERIVSNTSLQESFSCAAYNSNGKLFVGGSQGTVWFYELSDKQFIRFCHHRTESIQKILPDDKNTWIGYNWAGLDLTDTKGNLIAHYGSNPEDENKIHNNQIRNIYKDESGRIWISTYKGISIINGKEIKNILPREASGLPYNSIFKIFRDSKNGIWIGTYSGGLAYQSNYDNHFIHSRKDNSDNFINDEFVSSFAEKKDGTIIIGTEFGNLNRLEREANKMIKIPYTTENGKKIENIKSLLWDQDTETLWIGTYLNGFWFQRKGESTLRQLNKFDNARLSVYAIEKSDSGLWIGTFGSGLFHYNTHSGHLKRYISDRNDSSSISGNRIRALCVARDKSLYIGADIGLSKLNPKTGQIQRFNYLKNSGFTISSDEVYTIHEDEKGFIWVGTSGGGLNKYDPRTEKFISYQIKDGLVGNDVYAIQEDKKGILWVSTENGISSLDPVTENKRNFFRQDELEGNQFNPGAAFMTSSGEILFGDTKGFTLFVPEQMKVNPIQPRVVLTSLAINNIPVDRHTKSTPLKRALQTEKILKLAYDQNSLTFNYVANNFLLPNKNRFKYRLVNYDKNWIDAGTQNFATFTKIPPGEYLFEVIACNNDNIWNENPTQLKIIISPPVWLAWYAYLFYGMVILTISYFIRKDIRERQKFKKELMLERLLHESEAQVQEMKLRFFTNVSHEFRTPLTLIASPAKLLLEKFKLEPIVREHLLTMQRNSIRLLRLINQLIDIRKIELGKSVFQPQKTELITLCRDVISCFEMEARDKNIHLSFRPETKKLNLFLDPEKVDKIFFNILSNAMKFTEENGTITVSVFSTHSAENTVEDVVVGETINGNMVCVEFIDSGHGIDSKEINSIFERFAQGKNHQSSGTGIGLHMAYEYVRMHKGNIRVKSKIGEGSSFTISFPLTEDFDLVHDWAIITDSGNPAQSEKESNSWSEPHIEKEKTVTILIIEDNYELRNYLKNLLNQGYRVVTASNGKQGLETALTILPDLVITDIMMPQMDGFEVCRQLKNDIQSSHIPVIILTALNESEKQIGGLMTGADAYITKPFDENILLAQIENLILTRVKLREVFSVSDTEWAHGMEVLYSDKILIEKATSIVEQHLNDKAFVVDHLATHLGISTSSLYRKLKVLTNQSPTEFVRYIRLKKAIKLMNDGNSNVDEIGFAVGFNSHSYFTSSFKKQFGKTPSEYLNELKTKKATT